jgi:xylulokinase
MDATTEACVYSMDLGTSGPKVALVTTFGHVVGVEFEPVELFLVGEGGAEQSPVQWWSAISRATRRLFHRFPEAQGKLVAVGCTAQWAGTVAVGRTGEPLGNALIWMDSRGARYVRSITAGWPRIQGYGWDKVWRWLRITGGIPTRSGKDPLAHILYLKHCRPEIYRTAVCFLEPKDYINFRLTGESAASYDSITLHWVTDNRRLERVAYHDGLLSLAGIDRGKLPPLYRSVDRIGRVHESAAKELGLRPGLPVFACSPDIQAAAVGSGAVADFDPHLYVGTSSWITCHVPFKWTDIRHNLASLPSALPERYFVANEQGNAGVCLRHLRERVFYGDDSLGGGSAPGDFYDRLSELAAAAAPGSGGVLFTPWFNGERSPVEDRYLRAGWHRLSLGSGRPEMVRSVLEGVALNSRWLLGCVERFAGRRFTSLRFVGGGALSDVWCQIYADVLGRPIGRVEDPLAVSVRGAALLASIGLGAIRREQIAEHVKIVRWFEPEPATTGIYDAAYEDFLRAYRATRALTRRDRVLGSN